MEGYPGWACKDAKREDICCVFAIVSFSPLLGGNESLEGNISGGLFFFFRGGSLTDFTFYFIFTMHYYAFWYSTRRVTDGAAAILFFTECLVFRTQIVAFFK